MFKMNTIKERRYNIAVISKCNIEICVHDNSTFFPKISYYYKKKLVIQQGYIIDIRWDTYIPLTFAIYVKNP